MCAAVLRYPPDEPHLRRGPVSSARAAQNVLESHFADGDVVLPNQVVPHKGHWHEEVDRRLTQGPCRGRVVFWRHIHARRVRRVGRLCLGRGRPEDRPGYPRPAIGVALSRQLSLSRNQAVVALDNDAVALAANGETLDRVVG